MHIMFDKLNDLNFKRGVDMDIIIGMSVTFFILIFSIYKGIFVGYPLIISFLFLYLFP